MLALTYYSKALCKLNRATKNGSKAPHKPILLLSIIQTIDAREIIENKIEITPELVARFKDNWNVLVKQEFFKPNFSLPFYHLISDNFWHLKTWVGKEIALTNSSSIRSFSQLKDVLAYAYLDEALFVLLLNKKSREYLHHLILQKYFSAGHINYDQSGLFNQVAQEILHDSAGVYQNKIEKANEEEIFVRGGVFKKLVPQIYNYTCCISGMRIVSGYDIQMVDACHIKSFALSHNDTITNGIALCPNLHRAFDRD
ncbi:MAG: HNH endonuclease [Bacteroidetes bacterium]|nr:HNH endonuclease [Bacteroidota bacterium]